MEADAISEQLNALDWLLYRDDDRVRLAELLRKPEDIAVQVLSLMTELNERASKAPQNDVVTAKLGILDTLIDQNRQGLEDHQLFLYLGGSLLYKDPSNRPDYDLVALSLNHSGGNGAYVEQLEEKIYELDRDVEKADTVYVDLGAFYDLVHRLKTGNFDEDKQGFSRMDLHYLAHALTGRSLFVPSQHQPTKPEDIKTDLLRIYQKVPILGAICVLDLESVFSQRVRRGRKS